MQGALIGGRDFSVEYFEFELLLRHLEIFMDFERYQTPFTVTKTDHSHCCHGWSANAPANWQIDKD